MEVKAWTYEEMPAFTEEVEGAVVTETTGDETELHYLHDVEYAVMDQVPLHLQIIIPSTRNEPDKTYPCVVFVQGSAWFEQDVWNKVAVLGRLAELGYVIAIVQYRHSGIAAFPAQIQDARNAVRYMRLHASEYSVQPDNIIMAGDSSGGHTAVFAGMIAEGSELDNSIYPGVPADVKGIIDYYGCVSLMFEDGFPTTVNHHMPDSPEGCVMGHVDLRRHPELCLKATAETYITPDTEIVPVMILHGTKDRIVAAKQSVSLYRRLKECGKDVRLYLIGGADHGGGGFWTREICREADRFIRHCLEK